MSDPRTQAPAHAFIDNRKVKDFGMTMGMKPDFASLSPEEKAIVLSQVERSGPGGGIPMATRMAAFRMKYGQPPQDQRPFAMAPKRIEEMEQPQRAPQQDQRRMRLMAAYDAAARGDDTP